VTYVDNNAFRNIAKSIDKVAEAINKAAATRPPVVVINTQRELTQPEIDQTVKRAVSRLGKTSNKAPAIRTVAGKKW